MRVVLHTSFAASKKDPLSAVMERIRQAFLDAGLGEPSMRFNFSDAPVAGFVSSVDRVLKRMPELGRFVTDVSPMPGVPGARRISNGPMSPAAGEAVAFSTLQTIAAGVPRSFPFHGVAIQFQSPEFGELAHGADSMTGILLSDSWWINGRSRSLSACTVVEGNPDSKKLPPLPEAVSTVLAACGKVKRTIQAPVAVEIAANALRLATANPEAARAVSEIVAEYRAKMAEIVERAAMPHDLPALADAMKDAGLGAVTGPKKPVLDRAFKPMGYTCQGGSGTFTLRRRTEENLTVELYLDVGTWSRSVTAIFRVLGMGFKGTLLLPVTGRAAAGAQYPIGDGERWGKIVDNLAALVAELDRSFVSDVEAAAGPSPEWYQPES